ncbi:CNP1-like family protein [uncultured Thiohalocapsa sp.]|uniref:CNP1-like family protein n=1 Tax=uncultured Thiohalocapsa sp. TaxID=768990 RepID=UPI0025F8DF85|nr:CNP1-like family protein [uncultured Thiohalocapsa sp.]
MIRLRSIQLLRPFAMRSTCLRPVPGRAIGTRLPLLLRAWLLSAWLLSAWLLAGCGGRIGGYEDTPFKPDPEAPTPSSITEGRQWAEGDYRLPAWPRDADLVEVKLDGPEQPLTYYVDAQSLATGDDGVVRYTLVTESPSGGRSVSFEGLRCTPQGRFKTYAYGADGRFVPPRADTPWLAIDKLGGDRIHYDLWRHYLCIPLAFEARPTRDQLRVLRSGRVPQVENAGFMLD